MRRLLLANAALAVLLLGHVADHVLRQPGEIQLAWPANLPGIAGVLAVLVSLALVAGRHRYAVPVAGTVGVLTAVGFVAIHLLPGWSLFSDPFYGKGLDAVSWIEMLAALVGGAVQAAIAWGLLDDHVSTGRMVKAPPRSGATTRK